MGLTGMGFSTVTIAVGAIMYWAVTYQGHGFRFSTVGGHPHGRRSHRSGDRDDRIRRVTSSCGRPSACVRQADHLMPKVARLRYTKRSSSRGSVRRSGRPPLRGPGWRQRRLGEMWGTRTALT
jgi:hypothetical protein